MRRVALAVRVCLVPARRLSPVLPLAVVPAFAVAGCAGGQAVNGQNAQDFFPDPRVRALAEAAARGEAPRVAQLVREGADPNGLGREGMVPLIWAMSNRSHEGMRALLAAGANPNVEGPSGLKPLELAAGSTDPALLRILLDAKGNANARNSDGDPLLFVAVMHKLPANVQLLVEHGADVNAADATRQTPAQLAADIRQWGLAAWLIEHGADPTIPDNTGGTVAYTVENAGPPGDPGVRREYDHLRQVLLSRGVRFPAEDPRSVRLRVFGPDNPIDKKVDSVRARRARERGSP